jgi:hypothetical protein
MESVLYYKATRDAMTVQSASWHYYNRALAQAVRAWRETNTLTLVINKEPT